MDDCIFCRIVKGELEAEKIYEGEHVICVQDKFPQAPKHYLVMPKKHIKDVSGLGEEDQPIIVELFKAIKEVTEKENMDGPGYRLVINQGVQGGQTVYHLHVHILGGRRMAWPPG